MAYLVVAAACFLASAVGAICGIGGGVIIKPVLDALGLFSVATINALSGVTVLCMTGYNVIRDRLFDREAYEITVGVPIATGAGVGGLAGKQLYRAVAALFADPDVAGACQAVALGFITLGALGYTLNKERIATRQVTGAAASFCIGFVLGTVSSFLGIGGGPINLVVLYYFYGMDTRTAAQNSLYIILFSQCLSTGLALFSGDFSSMSAALLVLVAACGVAGGAAGRALSRYLEPEQADRLFRGVMVLVIGICVYNALRLGGVLA